MSILFWSSSATLLNDKTTYQRKYLMICARHIIEFRLTVQKVHLPTSSNFIEKDLRVDYQISICGDNDIVESDPIVETLLIQHDTFDILTLVPLKLNPKLIRQNIRQNV